jgi:hypothetical protein
MILKCPKCGSDNVHGAIDGNGNKHDDQAVCLDCEYYGYIDDSIYGKGFRS